MVFFKHSLYFLIFLGIILIMPSHGVAGRYYKKPAKMIETSQEWNGEFLKPREGLFYLNILLSNFKIHPDAKYQQHTVQFTITHLAKKSTHVFSQPAFLKETQSDPILWKVPEGQYVINKIHIVDSFGNKRTWKPETRSRSFTVSHHSISNLGRWKLKPTGKHKISVSMKMFQTKLSNVHNMKLDQVRKVIHGYNGFIQKAFAPRVSSVDRRKIDKKKLSKSYTITRTVSMYFQIDLFRHNRFAKKVARIISAHDAQFRKCYTDVLEFDERIRGQVKFKFTYSKFTRSMNNIDILYENVRDRNLTSCLHHHLDNIRIPLSENLRGELTYSFDSY